MSSRPLTRNTLFQVLVSHLSVKWSSSVSVGVTSQCPDNIHLPVSQLHLKRDSWVISGDGVYHNGARIRTRYGPNLNSLMSGHKVGVMVDSDNNLHLYIDGVDQGVACPDIPEKVWAVFDLYGRCDEIVIVSDTMDTGEGEAFVKETGDKEGKETKNMMTSSLKLEALPQQISRNCEYLALCTRFRDSLGLPSFYFDTSGHVTCYCDTCHKLRHEDVIQTHGDPKKKYALPIGWVRFPLRRDPRHVTTGSVDTWHVAYHGTNPGWVRRMLDTGKLLTQGEVGLERRRQLVTKSKEDDSDIALITFSPTINYAGLDTFSPGRSFSDRNQNGRSYVGKVALQVMVEPGSYKVGESQV